MKTNIRKGVFETNSSSTHSITICTQKEWEDFMDGLLYLEMYSDNLYTLEQIQKQYEEDKKEWEKEHTEKQPYYCRDFETYLRENFENYSQWEDDGYLETYNTYYKTPNGEEIVAFGKYGYDG